MSESYRIDFKKMARDGIERPIGPGEWQTWAEGLSAEQAKDGAKILSEVYVHVRMVKTTIEREVVSWQES